MNRQAYSKQYNEYKQLHHEAMNDAIKRFQQENPQRFAELQAQVRTEAASPPNGMLTFMFTGRLSVPRSEAQKLVEDAGHNVGSSVSKNTNYLVVGEDPGSKLHKTAQLGVQTIDEENLHAVLKGKVPQNDLQNFACRHCDHELSDQMLMFARISGGFTCPNCHTQNRF